MPQTQPESMPLPVNHFTFCNHPKCQKRSQNILDAARSLASQRELDLILEEAPTACGGDCTQGPFIGVPSLGVFYQGLVAEDLGLLFDETALTGRIIFERLAVRPTDVTDGRLLFDWQEGCLVLLSPELSLADAAAYLFSFNAAESCGKCTPCRMGVPQVSKLLNRLLRGDGSEADVARLEDLAWTMDQSAYCEFAGKVTAGIRAVIRSRPQAFLADLDPGGLAQGFTGGEPLPEDPAGDRGQFTSVRGLEKSYSLAVSRAFDLGGQHSGPGSLHAWGESAPAQDPGGGQPSGPDDSPSS